MKKADIKLTQAIRQLPIDHNGVKTALNNGASPNIMIPGESNIMSSKEDNEALLLRAALCGDENALSVLIIDKKTDLNCRDSLGRTPTCNLFLNGHLRYLPFFKENGADLFLQDYDGKNLAFYAVQYCELKDLIFLERLGLDITHISKHGLNLFHMLSLAKTPRLDIGKYLHSKKIDFKAKAKNGMTPIMTDMYVNKDKTLFNFYMTLIEEGASH